MSSLAEEIQNGGIAGTDEEIALVFTGTVEEYVDQTPWDWARLSQQLVGYGIDKKIAYSLPDFIQPLNGGGLLCRMFDKGVVLFNPAVREILIAAKDGSSDPVIDAILLCGIKMTPYWKKLGLAQEPTIDDVTVAKKEVAARVWRQQIHDDLLHDKALDGKDIASLKAAIAAKADLTFEEAMNIGKNPL